MAVRTRNQRKRQFRLDDNTRQSIVHYFPVWALIGIILLSLMPGILKFAGSIALSVIGAAPGVMLDVGEFGLNVAVDAGEFVIDVGVDAVEGLADAIGDGIGDVFASGESSGPLAPLFTEEIMHWRDDIDRWADEYDLDPNLLATVMQIESCGHPTVSSHAGAQGLFQVMPMHFASGEVMLDPDTNAMRGAGVLKECLRMANNHAGLAMACYNGGPSVLSRSMDTWLAEPQRYYYWGTGIYEDALNDRDNSSRLDEWLNAGGSSLCDRASTTLGIN